MGRAPPAPDNAHETLQELLDLLKDPQELYCQATQRSRQVRRRTRTCRQP